MANSFVNLYATSDRAPDFQNVFGRLENIPVVGWIPRQVHIEGLADPQMAWLLDLTRITPQERARLVEHIAQRFNAAPAEVETQLDTIGVPILHKDCLFHTTDNLPMLMADDRITDPGRPRFLDDETIEDDDFNEYDPADDLDEALSQCGRLPDGFCTLAGTEYCDWECPFS